MKAGYCIITAVLLAAFFVALAGCVPEVPEGADFGQGEPAERPLPKSLGEYERSIDYSCKSDSDCVIKDVGNCCGFYPRCVSKDAETNPDLVKGFCAEKRLVSFCGFPSISSCECVSGTCVGRQTSSEAR